MLLALILLLQLVLPLGAVVWLGWRTPMNWTGFWLHVLASLLLILAAALTGLWTALPWWLPLAYAVLLLLVGAGVYGNGKLPERRWPATTAEQLHLAACIGLALLSVAHLVNAGVDRLRTGNEFVNLDFPLPAGNYLIVDAGRTDTGHAAQSIAQRMARLSTWGNQSAGIAIVRVNDWGLRATGLQPSKPAAYFIFGTPVLAPCDGNVDALRADRPDRPVPQIDPASSTGNYVLLRCTDAVVLLANLRANSIVVARDERVSRGTPIAAVGNSGLTDEPHLHIQAMRSGSARQSAQGDAFVSRPLAIRFNGRVPQRNDRVSVYADYSAAPAAPRAAAAGN